MGAVSTGSYARKKNMRVNVAERMQAGALSA